eukprot:850694-Rhodomonas_salina.1
MITEDEQLPSYSSSFVIMMIYTLWYNGNELCCCDEFSFTGSPHAVSLTVSWSVPSFFPNTGHLHSVACLPLPVISFPFSKPCLLYTSPSPRDRG